MGGRLYAEVVEIEYSSRGRTDRSVFVLATSEDGTQRALREARALAEAEQVPLVLVVPVVTPDGPVPRDVSATHADVEHFRAMARTVGRSVSVRGCACREPKHVLGRLLVESATVVIGGRRGRWRMTREERLARELSLEGHRVTFVDADQA